jgi:hypothetical protein
MKDWKLTRNFSLLVSIPEPEFITFFKTRVESRKEFLAKQIKTSFEGDIDEDGFSIRKKWSLFVTDNSNLFMVKGDWEELGDQTQLNCRLEIKPLPQIVWGLGFIILILISFSQSFLFAALLLLPVFMCYHMILGWLDKANTRFQNELPALFKRE